MFFQTANCIFFFGNGLVYFLPFGILMFYLVSSTFLVMKISQSFVIFSANIFPACVLLF